MLSEVNSLRDQLSEPLDPSSMTIQSKEAQNKVKPDHRSNQRVRRPERKQDQKDHWSDTMNKLMDHQ